LSANPKEGVRQLNYVTGPDFEAHALEGLNEMATMFEAGELKPHIDEVTIQHHHVFYSYNLHIYNQRISAV